jgi:hypothetical protein
MPAAKKKPKKIFMPSDFGDRKARREYRKPGPVIIYKKVEAFTEMGEVIALEALLALPVDQAKELMLELSKSISDQKLAEAWSTHFTLVRKLRSILGIHKNHSGTIVNITDTVEDKWPPSFRLPTRKARNRAEKVVVMQGAARDPDAGQPVVRGLVMSIRGTFSGAELEPRIEAIRTLLKSCGDSKYTISLSLDEGIPARAGEMLGAAQNEVSTQSAPGVEDGFFDDQQLVR